jgi:SAM-dependent methyltransferase
MRDDANAAFYDGDSRSYDETRWVSDEGIFTDRAQQEIVADLTNGWSEVKILEAGPGTARFTIPLARKANRISLVDISTGMLETAQENLEKEGLGGAIDEARQGSLYELPFEDDQFDRAICLNVLSHIENSALALKELARVVRPGGEVLINYPNLQSYYWPAARRINNRAKAVDVDVYSIWDTPKNIQSRLESANLGLIRRQGHVHVPRSLERYHLLPVVRILDRISRRGWLSRFAPIHFCLCRKEG